MANTYVKIAKYTASAPINYVTFSNIPQTYTDLRLVVSARSTNSTTTQGVYLQVNGLGGTIYSGTQLRNNGGSANAYENTSANALLQNDIPNSANTANIHSVLEFYFRNYANAIFKPVYINLAKPDNNTTSYVYNQTSSSTIRTTSPITSIVVGSNETAPNFAGTSTFTLYGIASSTAVPTSAPKATGGDYIETDGTYWYHVFTSNGVFTPLVTSLNSDLLVVGGGGGGGDCGGGGGGGGGVYNFVTQRLANTGYNVTVGAGSVTATQYARGNQGGASYFYGTTTLQADGGGGGGGQNQPPANGGSSGGGCGGTNNYLQSVEYSLGQSNGDGDYGRPTGNGFGNRGGRGMHGVAAGGGGYSAKGKDSGAYISWANMYAANAGGGGEGLALPSAIGLFLGGGGVVASGGGGGVYYNGVTLYTAGAAGTGAGAGTNTGSASGGNAVYFGCGGGGGGFSPSFTSTQGGGIGYQGIVIVRYLV